MNLEGILFWVFVFSTLGAVLTLRRTSRWLCLVVLAAVGLVVAGALAWNGQARRKLVSQTQLNHSIPNQGRPDGYISSDRCQSCHPQEYASWHETYHRTMTQVASPESITADFNDVVLEFSKDVTFRLNRRGSEYWVDMPDPQWIIQNQSQSPAAAPRIEKRIGLLTGSHHMQVFWLPFGLGNLQSIFPFAWLIEDQRWVHFHNTFLRDPEMGPSRQFWNSSCINCHATAGQPQMDQATERVETRAGELGIACEACHGPAQQHVQINRIPTRRYLFHHGPQADPTIINPARLSTKLSSQVCGQCHGIRWILKPDDWSQHGYRFRPGDEMDRTDPIVRPTRIEAQPWLQEGLKRDPAFLEHRYWSDGMVRVSGREYNGLVESPCYKQGELSCLSCHSMHRSIKPDDQLIPGMESNQACLQCHTSFADRIAPHTHHRPESNGSLCYNCHMPHTTYGLLKAIRSHQIDSPDVRVSLATGRPNACNLCHMDKPLAWTARHLSDWYKQPVPLLSEDEQRISGALLWLLKGDAGQRALIAWSMGWEPAKQASGWDWLAPFLGQMLEDPYSAVRYISHRSLKRLPGFSEFGFDFVVSASERKRAHETAVALWLAQLARTPLSRSGTEVMLKPRGEVDAEPFSRLFGERNNRSMDLQE